MASISGKNACNDAASELLRQCLAGELRDAKLVDRLAADDCADALFRILIEGLADRFDPRLCDAYADIFCQILQQCSPGFRAGELRNRYERVRHPRVCTIAPDAVVVLSRVTLGADIAVTSVIIDAVERRFPMAAIYLAGSQKAAELFARDARVQHLNISYSRNGTIRDRLAGWKGLVDSLPGGNTIVVDPDSRLTQLGLLPVCDESRYFFFESRAYGFQTSASLSDLTTEWASRTFDEMAHACIAPPKPPFNTSKPYVTVSLGTGGNDLKRLPASFEADLIRLLCARFSAVIVDEGFGSEEALRARHAMAGTNARLFRGSFAQFASLIGESDCYVGYDSVGQHAAAACGTPLLTLFKGFASDRMFARWQPTGPGPKQILKLTGPPALDEITASLDALIQTV